MTDLVLSYLGRSEVTVKGGADTVRLVPNLARAPVAFAASLLQPLRFREAISALHDVVVSDHRHVKRDKSAYRAWQKAESERVAHVRAGAIAEARRNPSQEAVVSPELEAEFRRSVREYWRARERYSNLLRHEDPALWRKLVPCDPVITVAEDACLFECFSVDESAYGCLSVAKERGFGTPEHERLGTTNVDYSWSLFEHFQALRSYRETRFSIDATGFTVKTEGNPAHREEKIDLPAGWLRGFLQLQCALGLPTIAVPLTREAVYSLLVWLKRHRVEKSPRALRFELLPGKEPVLVLEPWEVRIPVHGARYDGPQTPPIRIWGRRRLAALARVLPLAERFTVHLVGTGMPSFWVAHLGEMTFTLGLSGWTTNDWTRGSALDGLTPMSQPAMDSFAITAGLLGQRKTMTLAELRSTTRLPEPELAGVLAHLAYTGQTMFDLARGAYRWRSVLPQPVGEAQIGPPNPEIRVGGELARGGQTKLERENALPNGKRFVAGLSDRTAVEIVLDGDGRIQRGKCLCGHFRTYGIRNGPCRHMVALRLVTTQAERPTAHDADTRDVIQKLFGE